MTIADLRPRVDGNVECSICGGAPCPTPSFCATCAQADKQQKPPNEHTKCLRRLMDDDISLDRAWREIQQRRGRR